MTVSDIDFRVFPKINAHVFVFFVVFRHKYALSHHATKSFNTGPWPTSLLQNKAVSSENFNKISIRTDAPAVICIKNE